MMVPGCLLLLFLLLFLFPDPEWSYLEDAGRVCTYISGWPLHTMPGGPAAFLNVKLLRRTFRKENLFIPDIFHCCNVTHVW